MTIGEMTLLGSVAKSFGVILDERWEVLVGVLLEIGLTIFDRSQARLGNVRGVSEATASITDFYRDDSGLGCCGSSVESRLLATGTLLILGRLLFYTGRLRLSIYVVVHAHTYSTYIRALS